MRWRFRRINSSDLKFVLKLHAIFAQKPLFPRGMLNLRAGHPVAGLVGKVMSTIGTAHLVEWDRERSQEWWPPPPPQSFEADGFILGDGAIFRLPISGEENPPRPHLPHQFSYSVYLQPVSAFFDRTRRCEMSQLTLPGAPRFHPPRIISPQQRDYPPGAKFFSGYRCRGFSLSQAFAAPLL